MLENMEQTPMAQGRYELERYWLASIGLVRSYIADRAEALRSAEIFKDVALVSGQRVTDTLTGKIIWESNGLRLQRLAVEREPAGKLASLTKAHIRVDVAIAVAGALLIATTPRCMSEETRKKAVVAADIVVRHGIVFA